MLGLKLLNPGKRSLLCSVSPCILQCCPCAIIFPTMVGRFSRHIPLSSSILKIMHADPVVKADPPWPRDVGRRML